MKSTQRRQDAESQSNAGTFAIAPLPSRPSASRRLCVSALKSSSVRSRPRSPAKSGADRRGISLMEVLISMFVLAIGLLGVAALIPAGRHEIVEATKLETAAMVGRNAFRDIQTRGYLNPNRWARSFVPATPSYVFSTADPANPFVVRDVFGGTTNGPQVAYAFDPLGRLAPAGAYGFNFPFSATAASNPPKLMRIFPCPATTSTAAQALGAYDLAFRSSVDLKTEPNATNKDLPPLQFWYKTGTTPLRRMSDGNYSWLATITSDPSRLATGGDVNVAVAVFYKRDMSAAGAGEYTATVGSFPLDPTANATVNMTRMPSGGEVVLANLPNDATGKLKAVKPGQWVMLAGFRMTTGATPVQLNYYRWYRVLSAGNPVGTGQNVTLAGQDWTVVRQNTQVWIFDNIVSVYEKSMPLELE